MNFKSLAFWKRDKGGDYSPPGDRYDGNNVYSLHKLETPFEAFIPHSGGAAPEKEENVSTAITGPPEGNSDGPFPDPYKVADQFAVIRHRFGPTEHEIEEAYAENERRDYEAAYQAYEKIAAENYAAELAEQAEQERKATEAGLPPMFYAAIPGDGLPRFYYTEKAFKGALGQFRRYGGKPRAFFVYAAYDEISHLISPPVPADADS